MTIKHLEKYSYKKGDKHPGWKGGRFHASNGYIWIYKPDHPNTSKVAPKGYVLEHRLVMERMLGRYLIKGEVVHHINSIRDDNTPTNLVLTTNSINVAISNATRPVTESYRKKRSENAKRFKRNINGKFEKGNMKGLTLIELLIIIAILLIVAGFIAIAISGRKDSDGIPLTPDCSVYSNNSLMTIPARCFEYYGVTK